jgi:hypothetical protein
MTKTCAAVAHKGVEHDDELNDWIRRAEGLPAK